MTRDSAPIFQVLNLECLSNSTQEVAFKKIAEQTLLSFPGCAEQQPLFEAARRMLQELPSYREAKERARESTENFKLSEFAPEQFTLSMPRRR